MFSPNVFFISIGDMNIYGSILIRNRANKNAGHAEVTVLI